ncbi:GNVR domain-containing protein [uncultured Paludibaculum sp.]|uniref:GumC family protein n=1 Tax=uncultured Paludibaculum sp. TaxID=1765020 RepID=UPI002AABA731|nr:GNVR domain-containing protein [uncultured Paludibaculum sp.]
MSTAPIPPAQGLQDQPISVPRRALDIEDYIDILRRHRSWILGPTFIGLVAGVVTAFLWPNSYMATGLIRVVPPQVSSRLVRTNITEEMTSKITSTYQNIISRPSLLNLIQTYNLYPDDRKRLPTDDIIENMRKDITLGQMESMSRGIGNRTNNVNAFRVAFSYSDRRLAQKVTIDLMSRFIDESIKSRSNQNLMTTEFFKDQFDTAKRELEEIDSKISAFRGSNMGTLPEQEQLALSRITTLDSSVQSVNSEISRAHQDKLQLEAQLRDLRDQVQVLSQPVPEGTGPTSVRNDRLVEANRDVERYEAAVASLRERYKDDHPDVKTALAYLQSKIKVRDQLLRESEGAKLDAAAPKPRMVLPPGNVIKLREVNSQISRIQTALQSKDMEIEDLNRQLADARGKLRNAQARLESSPSSNQEYVQLMRDRGLAATRYDDLSKKMQDSAMATDIETRKQGELLEVLEQPAIPEEPYAPKRPLIIAVGLIVGVGLGFSLAGGRELKDTSLKNLKDVRAYTRLTVLGSIPLLENDFVVKRRRRMGWLAWTATFLVGVLLMAGSVAYYYTSKA